MRAIMLALLAMPIGILAGCGPRYYPVDGKVLWSDESPAKELEGSQVVFESPEMKISARGTIGPDGGFTMTMVNPDDGVPPGMYQVAIIEERKPVNGNDWSKLHPPLLEDKFLSYAKSGLIAEVKATKNVIVLRVERKKK
jgi:hypothetical protein